MQVSTRSIDCLKSALVTDSRGVQADLLPCKWPSKQTCALNGSRMFIGMIAYPKCRRRPIPCRCSVSLLCPHLRLCSCYPHVCPLCVCVFFHSAAKSRSCGRFFPGRINAIGRRYYLYWPNYVFLHFTVFWRSLTFTSPRESCPSS